MNKRPRFYAVAKGKEPGVYTSWEDAKQQVEGNGPSQYKAFYSEVNARKYLRENKCPLGCSDRDLEAAAVRDKALYKKFGFEREEQPVVPTPTWYGVAKGKRPGVYSKWTDAKVQVLGYKGAVYKSFSTKAAAAEYVSSEGTALDRKSESLEASASTSGAESVEPESALKRKRRVRPVKGAGAGSGKAPAPTPSRAKGVARKPPPATTPGDQTEEPATVPASELSGGSAAAGSAEEKSLAADGVLVCYTDGSCQVNPGVAGWGVVVLEHGEKDAVVTRQDESGGRLKHDLWGPVVVDRKSPMYLGAERGTNNTGELCAVGEALIWLNHFEGSARPVVLRPDSEYAERVTTGQYNAKANLALVQRIRHEYQAALQQRAGAVYFRQIEAHQGHVWNERADALANKGQKSACQMGCTRRDACRRASAEWGQIL